MKNDEALFRQIEISRELARRKAQTDMLAFTRFTNKGYRANWHHKILCKYLDHFVAGDIKRLMVFMPPRHGKSELVSRRLPAYILGRKPDAQIIGASYSSDLSSMMNRDVQRIIDSDEYAQVFPDTRLNSSNVRTTAQGSYLRNSDAFEVVGRKGIYRSAGVGGGITGMGANYAIIDDPIKNQQDADSETMRENIWSWYTSTLYTRLMDPRSILLTLTRWHEDDLAGRLLQQASEDPNADQWTVLKLPGIYETGDSHPEDPRKEGEALWESDFGQDVMKGIRSSVGSRVWESLYQQRPTIADGNVIKRDWIRFYDKLPDALDELILVADLSFKEGPETDFTVVQCWGRKGANCYLIDQIRDRMDFPKQLEAIRKIRARNPGVILTLIEEAANGAAVIQYLKNEIMGIVGYRPQTSKEARVAAVSPYFESGNVYFPNPQLNYWVEGCLHELMSFPNAKHDDQVDCITMAVNRLSGLGSALHKMQMLSRM